MKETYTAADKKAVRKYIDALEAIAALDEALGDEKLQRDAAAHAEKRSDRILAGEAVATALIPAYEAITGQENNFDMHDMRYRVHTKIEAMPSDFWDAPKRPKKNAQDDEE